MTSENPYVGKLEADAIALAKKDGLAVRISSREGNHFVLTRDYRTNRVNFDVASGRVKRSKIG